MSLYSYSIYREKIMVFLHGLPQREKKQENGKEQKRKGKEQEKRKGKEKERKKEEKKNPISVFLEDNVC